MAQHPVRSVCAQPHQCNEALRVKVLEQSPLTRTLPPEDRAELARDLNAWSWHEGEALINAGEELDGSYLIVAGRVRVSRDTAAGKEITVDVAGPGDIIGPVSPEPVPARDSAWAMETTCALFLPAEDMAELVETYPGLALSILGLQQRQLAQAREREVAQTTRTVAQRVAAIIDHLAEKFGQRLSSGDTLLQVRIRREDIAGLAGTTLESTSRAMSAMKQQGILESGREWVSIIDLGALREIAHS